MFSATFPKTIRTLAKDFLADDFIFVKVGRVGSTTDNITQRVSSLGSWPLIKIIYVEEFQKKQHLMDLLLEQPPARTLIFVKSKRVCDSLDDYLYNLKFPCTSIHADRTQREREVISFVSCYLTLGCDYCISEWGGTDSYRDRYCGERFRCEECDACGEL